MDNKVNDKKADFVLEKQNFILMGIGLAAIVLGFLLMSGGKSDDPNVFNEAMFSFRRITLAPLLVFFGFVFQVYAILKKPKDA